MAALHPNQQVYFNALTDTNTPGALAKRYDMDYWDVSYLQSLKYLLARYPDDTLRVWLVRNIEILPQSDRDRIVRTSGGAGDTDFYIGSSDYHRSDTPATLIHHSIRAYGNVLSYILAPRSDAYLDYYRAEYNDVTANGTLLAHSDFDIYAHNGALHYIKENCAPLLAIRHKFEIFLHIFPTDRADLPADSRERGFENRNFLFAGYFYIFHHTNLLDGKCITRRPLPDYPIARIITGQNAAASGGDEWRVDIDLAAHAAVSSAYESVAAGDYGNPVAQSRFDLYLSGNRLAYLKEPCAPVDTDARFFLHIFPADPADLPADGREYGFVNWDFRFADHGGRAADKCVAERDLPDYPIERIRTGQFVSGEGQLWSAAFPALP